MALPIGLVGGFGGAASGADEAARQAAAEALAEAQTLTPQPEEIIQAGHYIYTPFGRFKAPDDADVTLDDTDPQTLASLQSAGLVLSVAGTASTTGTGTLAQMLVAANDITTWQNTEANANRGIWYREPLSPWQGPITSYTYEEAIDSDLQLGAVQTASFTAVSGFRYPIDLSAAADPSNITITLPANATANSFAFFDQTASCSETITATTTGLIEGVAATDLVLDVAGVKVELQYEDAVYGYSVNLR